MEKLRQHHIECFLMLALVHYRKCIDQNLSIEDSLPAPSVDEIEFIIENDGVTAEFHHAIVSMLIKIFDATPEQLESEDFFKRIKSEVTRMN